MSPWLNPFHLDMNRAMPAGMSVSRTGNFPTAIIVETAFRNLHLDASVV